MKKICFKLFNLIFFGFLIIYMCNNIILSGANFVSAIKTKSKATVGKIDINSVGNANTTMKLDFNSSIFTSDYEFSVTDNSEVSTKYNIITELPEKFPLTVDLKLLKKVNNNYQELTCISKNKNEYIWSDESNIKSDVKQHDYILRFSYNSHLDIERNINGIKIKIYAEQGD